MTIGIGFRCVDGIVLCSDTEISDDSMKYTERKIHYRIIKGSAGDCTIGLTYSGSPELMEMVWDKFLVTVECPSYNPTPESIKDSLESILRDNKDVITPDKGGLSILCGIAQKGGQFSLHRTQDNNIRPVPRFAFVGVGDSSLLRYLSPMLIGDCELNVNMAEKLGTYMVAKAKVYVVGCGGEMNMITLKPDGYIHLGDVIALAYERELEFLEHSFGKLIKAGLDTSLKESELDAEAGQFLYQLKKLRELG